MARALQLSLLAVLLAVPANGQGMCSSPNDGHGGHIVDITATIRASLPTWLSETGLGEGHRTETWSMLNGDDANASELTFSAHTGTHVDAPRHFVPWKNQHGMETVDIGAMNGPALLIEAYDVPVLNREALEALEASVAGMEARVGNLVDPVPGSAGRAGGGRQGNPRICSSGSETRTSSSDGI